MVALSVSTSANESSALTLSPTLKFHLLITPSVMVSLNNGIRITAAGMLDKSTAGSAAFSVTGAAGALSSVGLASAAGAAPPSKTDL
jgi:hypothetical protein